MKKILITFVVIFFIFGCGSKTYYTNSNQQRNFEQDVAYCKSVATGSVPMPVMQQYKNNTQSYAPNSGAMRDQYGNLYRYQENYSPMAAAQSNMSMAQQDFSNAAISLQNSPAQFEAQNARNSVLNQCMTQLGWKQISEKEYEHRQQLRANPYMAIIQAAEQGNAKAQLQLAFIYAKGQGIRQDHVQAVKWMQKAAQQGDANGQYHLGQMYSEGYAGLPKDDSQALEWFRKAAEQGHPFAQDNLGYAYFHGYCVPKNRSQAMEWYRKAIQGLRGFAENGMPEAQFKLAFLLFNGFGVAKDEAQAVIWIKKSAEQGYQPAQDELNNMKEDGYL